MVKNKSSGSSNVLGSSLNHWHHDERNAKAYKPTGENRELSNNSAPLGFNTNVWYKKWWNHTKKFPPSTWQKLISHVQIWLVQLNLNEAETYRN